MPRGTVMFCGQTELLEMVIVVDVELAVHVPPVDGPIELVELQVAVSAAIVPARTALVNRLLVWRMYGIICNTGYDSSRYLAR